MRYNLAVLLLTMSMVSCVTNTRIVNSRRPVIQWDDTCGTCGRPYYPDHWLVRREDGTIGLEGDGPHSRR